METQLDTIKTTRRAGSKTKHRVQDKGDRDLTSHRRQELNMNDYEEKPGRQQEERTLITSLDKDDQNDEELKTLKKKGKTRGC